MFTHLLLPTDGSELSETAVRSGVQFAKSINAKVTGFCVIPELHFFSYETEIPADVKQRVVRESRALAEKHLAVVEAAARKAGVTCDTAHVTSDLPYDAIVKAAAEKGCDLIMMASHGRRGVKGLLLGSETQKVLAHSKIPVLVFR
ncbi:MAG: universal stress protein [Deltaproteobacteria bacterium]|nr:universal stress protein [Deltaproteobacteria bacterium]